MTVKKHRWALSWPGNFCLDCGMEDQFEACIADCPECMTDENGFPDPSTCTIHAPLMKQCPPAPEDVERINSIYGDTK